jgi:hypothetical protein
VLCHDLVEIFFLEIPGTNVHSLAGRHQDIYYGHTQLALNFIRQHFKESGDLSGYVEEGFIVIAPKLLAYRFLITDLGLLTAIRMLGFPRRPISSTGADYLSNIAI